MEKASISWKRVPSLVPWPCSCCVHRMAEFRLDWALSTHSTGCITWLDELATWFLGSRPLQQTLFVCVQLSRGKKIDDQSRNLVNFNLAVHESKSWRWQIFQIRGRSFQADFPRFSLENLIYYSHAGIYLKPRRKIINNASEWFQIQCLFEACCAKPSTPRAFLGQSTLIIMELKSGCESITMGRWWQWAYVV